MRPTIIKVTALISVFIIQFFLVVTFIQIQYSLTQQKNKQKQEKSSLLRQTVSSRTQIDQKVLDQIKRNSETGSLMTIQPNDGIKVSDLSTDKTSQQANPAPTQPNPVETGKPRRIIIR
jgi:hypothetical protein